MNQNIKELQVQPFDEKIMTEKEFKEFTEHHNSGRGEEDE